MNMMVKWGKGTREGDSISCGKRPNDDDTDWRNFALTMPFFLFFSHSLNTDAKLEKGSVSVVDVG